MAFNVDALLTRLSILEARTQQEAARPHADPVRLGLLERMKSTVRADIESLNAQNVHGVRNDAA